MKKLLLFAAVLVLVCFVVVTFFGDNIKALFGGSADALSGDYAVSNRGNVSSSRLEKKGLTNFAMNNEYGGAQPSFAAVAPNRSVEAAVDHLSTFAVDVDTASYTYARRSLELGQRPDPASVRVEEWVNAFHYSLKAPSDAPFAAYAEGAPSPFARNTWVLKVALKGREVANADRKPAHLVFLVDVSGSMSGPDRLPLAKRSLGVLVEHLNARDTVAIATYAGDTRVVLEPTPGTDRARILGAIDSLTTGGGTAMGSGMQLAYEMAVRQVRRGETSRVIVLTDGDANIGTNTTGATILESIKGYVAEGVTLTTVGFGMGNYRAAALEQLADKGNGQSLYIDSPAAAERAFSTDVSGTLESIARDVKVQVDFDPNVVGTYKLIGYENRDVRDGDFRDDSVEGGALGAGHAVTAMYEVTLRNDVDDLGTVHVRGLHPDTRAPFETATRISRSALHRTLDEGSTDLRFATAVALAADTLRGNPNDAWPLSRIVELADDASDGLAERREFVSLMRKAQGSSAHVAAAPARGWQNSAY
jgi:Ca-activated chloride channel family protein